jgi:hypothetical protein
MRISRRDGRQLRPMARALRAADPHLAAMLAIFTRLTSAEALPPIERVATPASRALCLVLAAATAIGCLTRRVTLAAGRASRRATRRFAALLSVVRCRLLGAPPSRHTSASPSGPQAPQPPA